MRLLGNVSNRPKLVFLWTKTMNKKKKKKRKRSVHIDLLLLLRCVNSFAKLTHQSCCERCRYWHQVLVLDWMTRSSVSPVTPALIRRASLDTGEEAEVGQLTWRAGEKLRSVGAMSWTRGEVGGDSGGGGRDRWERLAVRGEQEVNR